MLGALVSFRSKSLQGLAEKTGVAMAIGLMIQMWLPFIISKILGISSGPAVAMGIGLMVFVICIRFFPLPDLSNIQRTSWFWSRNSVSAWLLILISLFLGWLFYTHCLQPTTEGLFSAGVCWEDQSYHAMLASSFLYSDNLTVLNYPHFNGWPLGYPFLPDLLVATLAQLGATFSQAFWWSAWYAGSAFILLAWGLIRVWVNNNGTATLALVLFLCAGGLGFMDLIKEAETGLHGTELLMKHDYVNAWELNLHYHNPLTGILLPMRTSLLGMPVALAILLLIFRLIENKGSARLDWITLGTLAGLLPLVHAHSFLVISGCGLAYSLLFFKSIRYRSLLWAIIPMIAIALPQLIWTHQQMVISDPPFIRIHLGWMCGEKNLINWLQYWLHNRGLLIPLGVIAWGIAPIQLKKWTAPLLALLILGNLIVFQPFIYDNIKLFVFTDLALSALAAALITRLWKKSITLQVVSVLLVFLLSASGILSIWRETRLKSLTEDNDGIAFANLVKGYTAPRSVFLTGSYLTHPVAVLTGRPMVMGFTNWLLQHGIPYRTREAEVKEMFAGGERALELLQKYQVDYVVIGPIERRENPLLNESFFNTVALAKFQQGPYSLYEVRKH